MQERDLKSSIARYGEEDITAETWPLPDTDTDPEHPAEALGIDSDSYGHAEVDDGDDDDSLNSLFEESASPKEDGKMDGPGIGQVRGESLAMATRAAFSHLTDEPIAVEEMSDCTPSDCTQRGGKPGPGDLENTPQICDSEAGDVADRGSDDGPFLGSEQPRLALTPTPTLDKASAGVKVHRRTSPELVGSITARKRRDATKEVVWQFDDLIGYRNE